MTWTTALLVERNGDYFVLYTPPSEYRVTMFCSNRHGDLLESPPPLTFDSGRIALYWLGVGYNDPLEKKYTGLQPARSNEDVKDNYNYPLIRKLLDIPMLGVKSDLIMGAIKRELVVSFYRTTINDRAHTEEQSYCYKVTVTGKEVLVVSYDYIRQMPLDWVVVYPEITNEFTQMLSVFCEYAETARHDSLRSYYLKGSVKRDMY